MYVVSYKFEVYPDRNAEFEKAWKEVTHLIYRHNGSMGSRLYRSGENFYFGIASAAADLIKKLGKDQILLFLTHMNGEKKCASAVGKSKKQMN